MSQTQNNESRWLSIGPALLWLAFSLGFWFHTSSINPEILDKYSPGYFGSLCFLTVVVPLVLWFAIGFIRVHEHKLASGRTLKIKPKHKFYLLLTLLVLMCIPGEWFFQRRFQRKLDQRARRMRDFHPFLQNKLQPNDPGNHTNQWGFRGEPITRKKPMNVYRVFVLGGSTVFCGNIPFEKLHTRILEKDLRAAYPDRKIEVQNAGLSFQASQHSLIKFLTDINDFSPDLIIVWHAMNDLYRSFTGSIFASGEPYREDYGHFLGPVSFLTKEAGKRQPVLQLLSQTKAFLDRNWLSDFRNGPPARAISVENWRSLPEFKRNFNNLVEIAKSKGVEVILASQPYLYKPNMSADENAIIMFPQQSCVENGEYPDIPSMIRGMDLYNRTAKEVADSFGIPFVDQEAMVPKTLGHFIDDVHYSEAGCEIIGKALARTVISQGLVQKQASTVAD